MNKKQKKVLRRILIAAALLVVFALLPVEGPLRLVLFLIPYLVIGYDILIKAFQGVKNAQPFDENFLMAVATVGAMALGEYMEGAAVMLLYQTGELFQSIAVGKSRRSIAGLMDIRPDYANLEGENGELEQVDPEEVAVGSVIVVQPGEKIPIDGVILQGESALNTAALTGESAPRDVAPGQEVISGCINLTGLLKIRTTKEFGESTVSKILDLVENAGERKSRSENFITKFARVYTPIVCFAALALAVLPPVARIAMGAAPEWGRWVYQALTFLVISCPCALVISSPLSFFGGIGGASTAGVLIKGSNYMETLAQVRCVVFDKTGTLTKGVFEVSGVFPDSGSEEELLELAALAESYSSHPISLSLQRAWGGTADKSRVRDVQEISGKGVTARIDGAAVAVGNKKLLELLGCQSPEAKGEGTAVYVAREGVYLGQILIADRPKPSSAGAIAALRKAGVKKTVMLTGDVQSAAQGVARELGLDVFFAELLPGDKVEKVEALLQELPAGEKLAFVGDGINDAPVLSRADVGIAMGAMGSDAAIEAADVVLMDDDPMKIAKAIAISRKCLRIVRENIVFALGVKLLCLALGVLGISNMWFAIVADVGVMILAVLNAVRALRV